MSPAASASGVLRYTVNQWLRQRSRRSAPSGRIANTSGRYTTGSARSRVSPPKHCRLLLARSSGPSASAGGTLPDGPQAAELLRVEIPTSDVKQSLRVGGMAAGRGRAIFITVVAPDSAAYKAGLREGCRLVAISDPARSEELWVLNDRVSLRFVRDSLRMRISPTIILVVEPPSKDWTSMSQAGFQEAERLQEELELARQRQARLKSEVEQRIKARKAYLGEVGQRDDSKLFAGLAAAFFLPAIVILTVAFASGYMDTLQMNTLRGL